VRSLPSGQVGDLEMSPCPRGAASVRQAHRAGRSRRASLRWRSGSHSRTKTPVACVPVASEGERDEGVLHGLLVQRGPEFLVVIALVLIGVGVGLDRDWLVGFGLVGLMLGVVLPRIRGSLEAGPSGIKVAEVIDPSELRARLRVKGKDLPPDAVQRAEVQASALLKGYAADTVPGADFLDLAVEGLLSEVARREWWVSFWAGNVDWEGIQGAMGGGEDLEMIAAGKPPGPARQRVLVNAPSGTEAVNRVRRLYEPFGKFWDWQVEPVSPPE
jgi:hypothetical protein